MKKAIIVLIAGIILVLIAAILKITGSTEMIYNIIFILGFISEILGVVLIIKKYKE